MIELTLLVELNQHAAEKRNGLYVVRVFVLDFLQSLVGLVEIVLVEVLLGLDEPNIQRVLLVQQIENGHLCLPQLLLRRRGLPSAALIINSQHLLLIPVQKHLGKGR